MVGTVSSAAIADNVDEGARSSSRGLSSPEVRLGAGLLPSPGTLSDSLAESVRPALSALPEEPTSFCGRVGREQWGGAARLGEE